MLLLGLLGLDQVVKIANHLTILKLHDPESVNPGVLREHTQQQESQLSFFFDSGKIEIKGEPLISTSVLLMDFLLVVLLAGLFALQTLFQSGDSLNYF